MGCRPNCGVCCDPVMLTAEQAQDAYTTEDPNRELAWIRDHLAPTHEIPGGFASQCVNYDVATRACLAHDLRPPMCRDFPFYGGWPNDDLVYNICSYQADLGRTILPVVSVTHGGGRCK